MSLKIGDGVELPDNAVTETIAMLAKRGMGKSNAAVVLAEEMWDHGAQWVAIDPKGDWWGIRSDANGKGPGLPVPVFGGRHGDLPLEPTAGTLMARLVIERDLTAVLDVSTFTKGEQIKFVTDFAESLFRLVGDSPRPLHLFLEEAEEFLPQRVDAKSARMVGAYSKISKQGRTFGLGVTLITQRSASLNKDALSQTDTLVLFRTVSPHDRKAVVAWAEHHDESTEVAATLSELKPGESWILSPGFLGTINRVMWRRRRTFDSGATPVAGVERRTPTSLADIDLGEIKDLMSETIERDQADDPKQLKKRIVQLERSLAEAKALTPEPERIEVEVPMVPESLTVELAQSRHDLEVLLAPLDRVTSAMEAIEAHLGAQRVKPPVQTRPPARSTVARVPIRREPSGDADLDGITGGAKRMLEALSMWPNGLTKSQLGTQAKVKKSGGSFGTYISRLRSRDLITIEGDLVRITETGLEATGGERPPADPAELREHWRLKFTGGARRMFDLLVDAYPDGIDKEQLSDLAEVSATGGSFGTYLSRLVSNECAVKDGNVISAHPNLFPEDFRV